MKITGLKTNHLDRPLGFDITDARLSWNVEETRGKWQTASRVEVTLDPDSQQNVYDSGKVPTLRENDAIVSGMDHAGWLLPMPLKARTRYFWRVTVWSDAGEEAVSSWTWFETPRAKDEPWQASWITSPFGREVHPVFSRDIRVEKQPVSARCYLLGLGLYEAYLNGVKVGEEVLAPGFHSYNSYLMYQTLELELQPGNNRLEILLGEGWYMGRYGLKANAPRYGEEYALLAEIRIRYADGEEVIGTDPSWMVTRGRITMDSIYHGETWDARIEPGEAVPAIPAAGKYRTPEPRVNPVIRVMEKIQPVLSEENPLVLDMGQNFAGWCGFWCDAPAGTQIRLRHAEYMKDGDVYLENLRSAKATFTYISDGTPRFVQPHFTYFGFRYVKVEGWTGPLDPAAFVGCVVYSGLERTGWIETGDSQLNRLFENTVWSQKSNFIDIPTDCPQRDERMGWTGDIQIFADTASFHMDTAAFLSKFMRDLRSEQLLLKGSVPCVVPMSGYELNGVAAWGDAACVVPWQIWVHSGDREQLRAQYPAMRDWVDWIGRENDRHGTGFLWAKTPQLGDWLSLDGDNVYGGTDHTFVATACYYQCTRLTALAAKALGEVSDAARYGELAENIRETFRREFFSASGRITEQTQTACAMVLGLELVPPTARRQTEELLARLIRENGTALQTGFVGTPWLLPALCEAEETTLAYDLLLRQEFPGWMYELNRGATTIWERWNSIEPDGSMNRDGMNSFNHYAYGSVSSWMYRYMAGIRPSEDHTGFRSVVIAPRPDRRISFCRARVASRSGEYRTAWQWTGETCTLDVHVPFDCAAEIRLPDGTGCRAEAGDHHFVLTIPGEHYSLQSGIRQLMTDPRTLEVLKRLFPQVIRGVAFQYELYTLAQLTRSPFSELTDSDVEALEAALAEIPMP